MKTTDIIARAGRNLSRAKMRTLLTSVAIAVGSFAIMVSLMAGEGARQYVDRVIGANMNPRTIMLAKGKSSFTPDGQQSSDLKEYNPDSLNMYGAEVSALNADDIKKLRERTDIENVEPLYQVSPKYAEFSVKPDKKYLVRMDMRDNSIAMGTTAGRTIAVGTALQDNEVIIPDSYLKTLGIGEANEMIGKTISVTVEQVAQQPSDDVLMEAFAQGGEGAVSQLVQPRTLKKEFKIVAVTQKTPEQAASSGGTTYISANAAKELADFSALGTDAYQKYGGALALVVEGKDPQEVKAALESADYGAMTAKDMQSMIFTFVNILQSIVMGFGILALIVSVFGIVNTMYISVLERTQQIGLMKALGASGRDIGRLFRYEAAWVGLLGGALGVLVAWLGALAFNPMISDKLGFGEHSLLIFQPLAAVGVIASLVLVAIVAGWLPSRRAAKLDPIEALRTE